MEWVTAQEATRACEQLMDEMPVDVYATFGNHASGKTVSVHFTQVNKGSYYLATTVLEYRKARADREREQYKAKLWTLVPRRNDDSKGNPKPVQD
jgi:hypothetical protein